MQVGKTVFLWLSTRAPGHRAHERDPYHGLAVGVVHLLVAAALRRGRYGWRCGAGAAIEYISPAVRFWIPKYGGHSWRLGVEGGHMAERCAGFIIIALGESLSSRCDLCDLA